ncbi:MAG: 30S ribosomal protein S20 [bacterium]
MAKRNLSAIRQARKNIRHRIRNRTRKVAMKKAVKLVRQAKTKEEAMKAFVAAQSLIDRCARHRVIHPNTASRLKSRLIKQIAYIS